MGENLAPTYVHGSAKCIDLNQVETAFYIVIESERRLQRTKFYSPGVLCRPRFFFALRPLQEDPKKIPPIKKIRNYRFGVVVEERAPPSQPHKNIIRTHKLFLAH